MAPPARIPSAASLTTAAFHDLLRQYHPLIKTLSDEKSAKPGQKTLLDLDNFRYNEATASFRSSQPKRQMDHDDVKTLVDWKLRHGKFRPTLMKLVESNDGAVVSDTISSAMTTYWGDRDTAKALAAICKVKGIGPATASLLLSVHDPESVIFFSDEVYYWLCCDGSKPSLKYNNKEYQALSDAAETLAKRLAVSAMDIERVAYVVMRQEQQPASAATGTDTKTTAPPQDDVSTTARKTQEKRPSGVGDGDDDDGGSKGLRRSKRGKAA